MVSSLIWLESPVLSVMTMSLMSWGMSLVSSCEGAVIKSVRAFIQVWAGPTWALFSVCILFRSVTVMLPCCFCSVVWAVASVSCWMKALSCELRRAVVAEILSICPLVFGTTTAVFFAMFFVGKMSCRVPDICSVSLLGILSACPWFWVSL